ncbi:YwqH-like family protein [Bacillus cihuensis]|uniref:YwqH-like family protein n=1 Tax=Bacillus cihuensis TaxID=1208599 RepID=UPI00041D8B9D|nr:DUF5082 family protein [Bacillus cihuensis]
MSLAYYYSLLRLKEEQLHRLQICNSELNSCQQDFIHHERLVSEPELSTNTWNAALAHTFDNTRAVGMLTNYRDISNNQFSSVFTTLAEKIQQIQLEIISIKQTIAALEAAEREEKMVR